MGALADTGSPRGRLAARAHVPRFRATGAPVCVQVPQVPGGRGSRQPHR